jgi:hypothetical protein
MIDRQYMKKQLLQQRRQGIAKLLQQRRQGIAKQSGVVNVGNSVKQLQRRVNDERGRLTSRHRGDCHRQTEAVPKDTAGGREFHGYAGRSTYCNAIVKTRKSGEELEWWSF